MYFAKSATTNPRIPLSFPTAVLIVWHNSRLPGISLYEFSKNRMHLAHPGRFSLIPLTAFAM